MYNLLEGLRDTLWELRKTNDSLLTTKTNEIMKTLTIMAFVTFPPALFAAVFGMNTVYTPIVGVPNDFWIIAGIMFTGMLLMFAFFKHKRWF